MKKIKKPSLKKALTKLSKVSKETFGIVKADLSKLPKLKRNKKNS